jgi:hypothetical protein
MSDRMGLDGGTSISGPFIQGWVRIKGGVTVYVYQSMKGRFRAYITASILQGMNECFGCGRSVIQVAGLFLGSRKPSLNFNKKRGEARGYLL